jgi:DNA-binding XRE family transcriptional regulator
MAPNMTPEQFRMSRKELRLTQSMLADRMGVTKHTIINIETGKSPLRAVYIEALTSIAGKVAAEMAVRAQSLQAAE